MKLLILTLAITLAFSLSGDKSVFPDEDWEAGLLNLAPGDEMFYWLIKSRQNASEDPLVLWLTGGPGCSSQLALFYENGPWTINEDLSLETNPYSWNEISNLLFVDQPLGTGFSKTKRPDHMARDEEMVAETFHVFLEKFVEKYPEFKGRPFYITGESYAGHYIPAISAKIIEKGNPDINLVSSAIGNGWVDPFVQYGEYDHFAYEEGLVGWFHHMILKVGYGICRAMIKTSPWLYALEECQMTTQTILGIPGFKPRFNVYDIRIPCEHGNLCYDFTPLEELMAKPEVREALNVGKNSWSDCNMAVHTAMLGDWMADLSKSVTKSLHDGVNFLVYSGDKDFICNWRGGEAWTDSIVWDMQEGFQSTDYQLWKVDGEPAGEYKKFKNLTFLRVYDAGHMVPMDQPARSLQMLKEFIHIDL